MNELRRTSGFALRELVLLSLVAGLLVLSKALFRISIHVPGHTGIFWMALLVIARGIVRRNGAGTLVGVVSGLLAVMLVPGQEGIFTWVKYAAPGIALDLLVIVLPGGLYRPVQAAVMGAFGNLAKLAAGYLLAIALGLPSAFIAAGLGIAAVSHAAFGAAGGALGALLLQRLYRARPDLAPADLPRRPAAPGGGGPKALGVMLALVLAATTGVLAGPAGPAAAATVWTEGTATRPFSAPVLTSAVQVGGSDPAVVPRWDMVWSAGFTGLDPRSAQFVGDNVLIASRDGRAVYEIDRSGRIVWSYNQVEYRADIGSSSADFLPFHASRFTATDGTAHTLITQRRGAPIIEIDENKDIVWRYGTGVVGYGPGQLADGYSATRLPNGNTLIADNQGCRVLEVRSSDFDPTAPNYGYTAASIVWAYGIGGELGSAHGYAEGYLDWPRTAVRLSNGNTLITDQASSRALEVTPAGHVVWSYGHPGIEGREDGYLFEPSGAVRLPDGTTAISHGKLYGEVVFVDGTGAVVKRFPDSVLSTPDLGMSELRSIGLSAHNSILIADEGNDRVIEAGVVPTAKLGSGRIDCGLPGVRKKFSALTWQGSTPAGTSIELYYSIDGGAWQPAPAGGALPESAAGVYLNYRAVLSTTDSSRAARLESVSITYALDTGQDETPEVPAAAGDDGGSNGGTGGTTNPSRTSRGSSKVTMVPKRLPGGLGGSALGSSGSAVRIGGDLPPGLVEASGRVLGRVRILGDTNAELGTGGGSGRGSMGLGAGEQATGGLVLLGGVYLVGFGATPARAMLIRLVLRRI